MEPAQKQEKAIPEPVRKAIDEAAAALTKANKSESRKSEVEKDLVLVDNTMRIRKIKTRDGWHDLDAKPEFRAKFDEIEKEERTKVLTEMTRRLEERYRKTGNDAEFIQHTKKVVTGAESIAIRSEMETVFAMQGKLEKDAEGKLLSEEEKKRKEYDFSHFTDDLRKRAQDFQKQNPRVDDSGKQSSLPDQLASERAALAALNVPPPIDAMPSAGMQVIGMRQAGIPGRLAA
jgi:hypothetical protein